MDTRQKSEVACLKVQTRAIERGMVISKPTTDARYDLVLDDGSKLNRVQVKFGGGKSSHSEGVATVALRTYVGNKYKFKTYREGEVDLLLVYLPQIDKVVAFKPEEFEDKAMLYVRLTPAKNNVKRGILMAEEHLW
jgi:hypothetical protein